MPRDMTESIPLSVRIKDLNFRLAMAVLTLVMNIAGIGILIGQRRNLTRLR